MHSSVNLGILDTSHNSTSQLTYRVAIRKGSGYGNVEFPVNNGDMYARMTLMEIAH